MREHPAEADHDRLHGREIVGDAARTQAIDQHREPIRVARLAPCELRVMRDACEVRAAIGGLGDQHAVEQQLDPDMRDRTARPARTAALVECVIELAHQPGDDRQHVKGRIGRVMDVDAACDGGLVRFRDPAAAHRLEVGQHRAEQDAGLGRGPARDRCVAEEVHALYYHLAMASLVVGLDLGTQSVKAVVCDAELAVLGQHALGYPTSYPGPDRAEQDPRAWEAAIRPAIEGAIAAAGVAPADIAAIAIAGQLDGCIAVDAHGEPVSPALIWQDRRAHAEAARVTVFDETGQIADASHMAPKIAWLRANGITAVRFHQPVSYLVERLCGAAVIDPALASTTMLLELATQRWSPRLLAAFDLEPALLPRLAAACDVAGSLTARGAELTGLAAGTRVAVGTGDDFATPLGAGVIAPGPIICAVGTAEVVGALAATAVLDRSPEPMVETHVYPTGAFFIENPGWMAGGAVRWATRLLGLASDAELDAHAMKAPPGAAGVTFVPALAGAMTPVWRPHARATFHGLAPDHDRTHMARAVLEGLAFATRDVIERLRALGLAGDRVLVLGGGAKSTVWNQIRADVVGLPHDISARTDACPIGAAMIALVAAGLAPDLATLAARSPSPSTRFEPTLPRDAIDAAYHRYQRLVGQLAPLANAAW